MLTAFGKALRKIRIDRNLLLKDMADGLGCSSPFLSAIESGTKKIPDDMIERISNVYKLTEEEVRSLEVGRDQSVKEVKMELKGYCEQDRELALAFARSFESLDASQKEKLKKVLLGGKKNGE